MDVSNLFNKIPQRDVDRDQECAQATTFRALDGTCNYFYPEELE